MVGINFSQCLWYLELENVRGIIVSFYLQPHKNTIILLLEPSVIKECAKKVFMYEMGGLF